MKITCKIKLFSTQYDLFRLNWGQLLNKMINFGHKHMCLCAWN